jgi:hypothetical protein
MRLICSGCGRQVGAGRYYRTGDACGVELIKRKASIRKTSRGLVWINQITARCLGTLSRVGK